MEFFDGENYQIFQFCAVSHKFVKVFFLQRLPLYSITVVERYTASVSIVSKLSLNLGSSVVIIQFHCCIYSTIMCVCVCVITAGNRQKKANALIEASGLRMIAVEDFDKAAQTVSDLFYL